MMGSVEETQDCHRETLTYNGGRGDLHLPIAYILIAFLLTSCTAPPVTEEKAGSESIYTKRVREIRSVAYIIDLRLNDNGKKHSTITELYFQGDSVGFYGRGYFGKGSFKGKIINDTVTIYFPSQRQYFIDVMADSIPSEDCSSSLGVVFYALSLLSGRYETFFDLLLDKQMFHPEKGELIYPCCGDTIIIKYSSFSRKFPYYKPQDISVHRGSSNFEAKGFIRQQVYNQLIDPGKFTVIIPSSAVRIDSL